MIASVLWMAMQAAAASDAASARPELGHALAGMQQPARAWPGIPPGAPVGVWIENCGQWPGEIRFLARVPGGLARIEHDAIALQVEAGDAGGRLVRLQLGSTQLAEVQGVDPLEARYHFFIGSDSRGWVTRVQSFERVRVGGTGPDRQVDLRADSSGVSLELGEACGREWRELAGRIQDGCLNEASACDHQWVETPDAKPGAPRGRGLRFRLASSPANTTHSNGGALAASGPPSPSLLWSTYLGGSAEDSAAQCAWANGEIAVVGGTTGTTFPKTAGTYQHPGAALYNGFVTKFSEADGRLIYSSIIGGSSAVSQPQEFLDVALDALGRSTCLAVTNAPDFPTTPGAFQRNKQSSPNSWSGAVTQLTADGSALVFSTYLEGQLFGSYLLGVDTDDDGNIYVTGAANRDFPTTSGAFSSTIKGQLGDAIVCKLNDTGTQLLWSTFLGGSLGEGGYQVLKTDSGVLVGGLTPSNDFPTTPGAFKQSNTAQASVQVFLTELNSSGSALNWSTYVGGRVHSEDLEWGGMALDPLGNVVLAGRYKEGVPGSFPVTPGAFKTRWEPRTLSQGFVLALDPVSQKLRYSTLLGGEIDGGINALWIDTSGIPTVASGINGSGSRIPLTPGAFDTTISGVADPAIVRFSPSGNRVFYSTLLGGPSTASLNGLCGAQSGRIVAAVTVTLPGGWPTTPNALAPTYQGGLFDGAVTTFDLYLKGLDPCGSSSPSCKGPLQINGTEMPAEGAESFGLWCSGAPPLASGFLLLGDLLSQPIPWNGVELWIDPAAPFVRALTTSDEAGYAEIALPIPPGSQGQVLGAQYFFPGTAACGGPLTWSASHALEISVQPAP